MRTRAKYGKKNIFTGRLRRRKTPLKSPVHSAAATSSTTATTAAGGNTGDRKQAPSGGEKAAAAAKGGPGGREDYDYDDAEGERQTREEMIRERAAEAAEAVTAYARLAVVILQGSMWQPLVSV